MRSFFFFISTFFSKEKHTYLCFNALRTSLNQAVFESQKSIAWLTSRQSENEGSLTSTLRTLLFFTTLMITLPVGLYFSSKAYVFEGTLGMSDRDSYFYAAIVAVVTVHVVLALFVYVAWNEGSRQWREGKQD
uniref:Vacuolar ATPase assembly integral membrane protein VMA21 n=1 Tax=Corvus moneduloides TaxID=1196302 RepID=A0A8U7MPF0_CORMO